MSLKDSNARDEVELQYSLFTWHPFMEKQYSQKLSNKKSQSGRLINNDLYAFKWSSYDNKTYEAFSLFAGKNSVDSPMSGFSYSSGSIYNHILFGYIVGLYVQDETEFDNRLIRSASIIRSGKQGITPILGLEIGLKLPITDSLSIKINNVITPAVTNHSISFAIDF